MTEVIFVFRNFNRTKFSIDKILIFFAHPNDIIFVNFREENKECKIRLKVESKRARRRDTERLNNKVIKSAVL